MDIARIVRTTADIRGLRFTSSVYGEENGVAHCYSYDLERTLYPPLVARRTYTSAEGVRYMLLGRQAAIAASKCPYS